MFEQFKLYIYGAILISVFLAGYNISSWKRDSEVLALQNKVAEANKVIITKQDTIEAQHEDYRKLQDKKQQVIIKKVIEYVATGNMSPDWLLSYDCSTISASEDTSCELNGYSSAIRTDRDALIVATHNNLMCNGYIKQLSDLQDWVRSLYIKN